MSVFHSCARGEDGDCDSDCANGGNRGNDDDNGNDGGVVIIVTPWNF